MAARSVYLAVSDTLRACNNYDPAAKHVHTGITTRLRHGVIDSELRFNARLSSMQAWSALHGRSNVKLEEATVALNKIYFDALAAIPYLSGGTSYEESKKQEDLALLAQYEAHMAARRARKKVDA